MKKHLLCFTAVAALFFTGCGGGGSSGGVSYDDPKIVNNKTFFRVTKGEEYDFYTKEIFDENNGTLYVGKYDQTLHNLEPDSNQTIPYRTDLSYVYLQYDTPIRCRVIDTGLSVEFWCIDNDFGVLSPYPTRWKSLDDANDNPED